MTRVLITGDRVELDPLRDLIRIMPDYERILRACQVEAPALFRGSRRRLGLTQRQLAVKLDVNHTYISKIEGGKLPAGRPILKALARLLAEEGGPS